jgi:hypothetical protein
MPNRPAMRPVPPLSLLGVSGKRLARIAQALRARTAAQAKGHCFSSSMEFCLAARNENVNAELVVWSVKGDPDFLEHWAVKLSKDQIVDLTRMQVDGRSGVHFALDDYPANFVRRRIYPAHLFLPAYEAQLAQEEGPRRQLSLAQLLHWRWQMLLHDCRAGQDLQIRRVAHAAASCLKLALMGSLNHVAQALRARRERLLTQLMGDAGQHGARAVKLQPHPAANDAAFVGHRPIAVVRAPVAAFVAQSPTTSARQPCAAALSCKPSQTQACANRL